jgi:TonB family protein
VTNRDVQRDFAKLPVDLRFAAAVAGTGQLLRHDPSIKSFDFDRAIEIADGAKGADAFGYRAEFVSLLQRGGRLATIQAPSLFPRPARLGEPVYAAPNPPQPLSSHAVTADDYPPVSIRLQEQGKVMVRYVVEADGSVNECTVETTSGRPRLDDAACVLVRKWRYTPATLAAGKAVPMWLGTTINFELR